MSEDDGQPDEAKEWEDFEGPQEIYETDPWNIAREEFKKRRMSKKSKEKLEK